MRSILRACSDDRVARARQGALSAEEWQELAGHLATCPDCRITWRLAVDFEHSAATAPGDERLVERATRLALSSTSGRRIDWFGLGIAAAVTLAAASVASGALMLRGRHAAEPTDGRSTVRSAGRVPSPGSSGRALVPDPGAALPPVLLGPAVGTSPRPEQEEAGGTPRPASQRGAERPLRQATVAVPGAPPPSVAMLEPPLALEDATTLFARALAERAHGQREAAVATFRSLQRRFPKTPEAVLASVSLGDLLLDAGRPADALLACEQYLASAPSGALAPEAWAGRARALTALGRHAEADAAWREIARRFPPSPHGGRGARSIGGGSSP